MRVFPPRFERERRNAPGNIQTPNKEDLREQKKYRLFAPCRREEGISFKEVLTGMKTNESFADEGLLFQPLEDEKESLKGAYTGYIKNEFILEEIEEEINCESAGNLKVTTMGGNFVLIQNLNEQPVEKVLEELNEWRSFWFQWCRS